MTRIVRTLAALVVATTLTIGLTTIGAGTAIAAASEAPADPTAVTDPAPVSTTVPDPTPPPAPPQPPAPPVESQGTDVGGQAVSTLTIKIDAVPNSTNDFGFAAYAGSTTFSLDDDANVAGGTNVLSNTKTLTVAPSAIMTVNVPSAPGYIVDAINCTGGATIADTGTRSVTFHSPPAGITVNSTCTFVAKEMVHVSVTLDTQPNSSIDFAYMAPVQGGGFMLDDDGDPTLSNVATFNATYGATHSVLQNAKSGWAIAKVTCPSGVTLTGTGFQFKADPGQHISCKFTVVRLGTISIQQDTKPNGPTPFTFTSWLPPSVFDDDVTTATPNVRIWGNLPVNKSYTITQAAVPGWALESIVCNHAETINLATRTLTANISVGEDLKCTFANGRPRPDALVGPRFQPLIGDDVYATAVQANQTSTRKVARGAKTRFVVNAVNDAGIVDSLRIKSIRSGGAGFKVQVFKFDGTTDITTAVKNGTYVTGPLDPQGEKAVIVQIKAKRSSHKGRLHNVNVIVQSTLTGARDVVRARAVRA